MIDTLAEIADEFDVVHALIAEVRRIVIESEALVISNRSQRALGGSDVECDFRGVDFEREIHIDFFKRIEDRQPALGEVLEAFFVILLRSWREGVDGMPDRGTGETVDYGGKLILALAARLGVEEQTGGLAGSDHLFGGTLADAFRASITPDGWRKNCFVTLVDEVANRLTHEVAGNGVTGEAVIGK